MAEHLTFAQIMEQRQAAWMQKVKSNCLIHTDGCWIWQGHIDSHGYGQCKFNGKDVLVHRKMYELTKAVKLPREIFACHSCDVRRCCNPDHIWAGTNKQNMFDCVEKERHAQTKKQFCVNGHPLTGDNVSVGLHKERVGNQRVCKTCARLKTQRYRQRKRDQTGSAA